VYRHDLALADFFVKIDDDALVFVDGLRRFLVRGGFAARPDRPWWIGHTIYRHLTQRPPQLMVQGGATDASYVVRKGHVEPWATRAEVWHVATQLPALALCEWKDSARDLLKRVDAGDLDVLPPS
jgi:hypothetical protein